MALLGPREMSELRLQSELKRIDPVAITLTLAAGSAFIGLRFRARRNQTSAEMPRIASIASVQPSGFAAMI
jgi:hypothetical protein